MYVYRVYIVSSEDYMEVQVGETAMMDQWRENGEMGPLYPQNEEIEPYSTLIGGPLVNSNPDGDIPAGI